LTGVRCLELKYHKWLADKTVYKHTLPAWLVATRHGGCLSDKQIFKASMNECNELFFQTLAAKSLSFTDYEILTKTIIPPETLLQPKWQCEYGILPSVNNKIKYITRFSFTQFK
jgi:hypothetical protein